MSLKTFDTIRWEEHVGLAGTAICVYDALVEHFLAGAPPSPWETWRDNHGSATVRHWCIVDAAPAVDNAWLHCCDLCFGMCFDFEFVPMFLDTCVEWRHDEPVIREDAAELLRGLLILRTAP